MMLFEVMKKQSGSTKVIVNSGIILVVCMSKWRTNDKHYFRWVLVNICLSKYRKFIVYLHKDQQ